MNLKANLCNQNLEPTPKMKEKFLAIVVERIMKSTKQLRQLKRGQNSSTVAMKHFQIKISP